MSRIVPPAGSLSAPLVVCGRDPGSQETMQGVPFVGDAGYILDRGLKQAGISRSGECLITNVVPIQPHNNLWENHDPADIRRGSEAALQLIHQRPRRLVVALGEQAASVCLGGSVDYDLPDIITNLRGYVFTDTACGCPVLVGVHPAFIARNWHPWWATSCWDWQKAARWLRGGGRTVPGKTHIIRSLGEGDVAADRLGRAQFLSVDVETSGVGCVGFADSYDEAWVWPGKPSPSHPYREQLTRLLGSGVPIVMQNGQFDMSVFEGAGWDVANWKWELQGLWHAHEPLLAGAQADARGKSHKRTEKSLRFLGSLLTDEPYWKSYDFTNDDEQYTLCGTDNRVQWECCRVLLDRLK